MLFAENSCCTGCPAPCAFRARKRREVSAQAFAKALRNLSDDPVCNNAAVKRLIEQVRFTFFFIYGHIAVKEINCCYFS